VLKEELANHGIAVLHPSDLNEKAQLWLDDHFTHEIFPVLTPLAADPAHPFPFIPNGGTSLALSLRRPDGVSMSALLPLPNQMPRFIRLPGRPKKPTFVTVEDVICRHLDSLFPGLEVEEAEHFRILRDSDVEIEEKAEDLLLEFESLIKRRRRGSAISLRVSSFMSKEMRDSIIKELHIQEETVFQASGLVGIGDLRELIVSERPDLPFRALHTAVPREDPRFRW
jgi:polyphosphate kinase